jgi:hypothetical protein
MVIKTMPQNVTEILDFGFGISEWEDLRFVMLGETWYLSSILADFKRFPHYLKLNSCKLAD